MRSHRLPPQCRLEWRESVLCGLCGLLSLTIPAAGVAQHHPRPFAQGDMVASVCPDPSTKLLEDHYDRQARHHASRMVQAMMVHEKHQAVDKRLTAVRREKEESLAARRQASVRSSLQRRAIIVNKFGIAH